jgi:hypothetical protein
MSGDKKKSAHNEASSTARATRKTVSATFGVLARGLGRVGKIAGGVLHVSGKALRRAAEQAEPDNVFGQAARGAAIVTGAAAQGLGIGTHLVGQGAEKLSEAAEVVGAAAGGAVDGTVGAVTGTVDYFRYDQKDLDALAVRLRNASARYAELGRDIREGLDTPSRRLKKGTVLDTLTVGGLTLAELASAHTGVPEGIREAFERAYPDVAAKYSFERVVQTLDDPSQVMGFAAGVKGKLFEMQYVDWLNDGNLPANLTAELAKSATQPAWDIRIVDDAGRVVDALQAKATDSVAYVQKALAEHPHIDVVTTREVYHALTAQGLGEQVLNGQVADATLESLVSEATTAAADGGFDALGLPLASVAVVALLTFTDSALGWSERSQEFGHRASQATLAAGAGGAAMALTHTWVLALVAAAGSRWVWGKGQELRSRYERLSALVAATEGRVEALRGAKARLLSASY